MKFARLLAFGFVLFACQPTSLPSVTITDNGKVITLQAGARIPSVLLDQAGIKLNPNDRVLLNGLPIPLDQPIASFPITLQIRHAVTLTLITLDGERKLQSSAFTVGEAIQEASIWLRADDQVAPTLDAALKDGMKIEIT